MGYYFGFLHQRIFPVFVRVGLISFRKGNNDLQQSIRLLIPFMPATEMAQYFKFQILGKFLTFLAKYVHGALLKECVFVCVFMRHRVNTVYCESNFNLYVFLLLSVSMYLQGSFIL